MCFITLCILYTFYLQCPITFRNLQQNVNQTKCNDFFKGLFPLPEQNEFLVPFIYM